MEVMRGDAGFSLYATPSVIDFVDALLGDEGEKVGALLERVSEHGIPKQKEKSGVIADGLFELKSYQVRIGFMYGNRRRTIFLIHAFKKKTNRWPNHERTTAQTVQSQVSQAIKEGNVQYVE